jgi:hypothetical protein
VSRTTDDLPAAALPKRDDRLPEVRTRTVQFHVVKYSHRRDDALPCQQHSDGAVSVFRNTLRTSLRAADTR